MENTCERGIDNEVYGKVMARLQIELLNRQLIDRIREDKLGIAIETLRLLQNCGRMTLQAVADIAGKALNDIANTGNPETS